MVTRELFVSGEFNRRKLMDYVHGNMIGHLYILPADKKIKVKYTHKDGLRSATFLLNDKDITTLCEDEDSSTGSKAVPITKCKKIKIIGTEGSTPFRALNSNQTAEIQALCNKMVAE